ncbi:MAG: hypothetical protein IPN15_06485 [Saprospiraceae bacterium]|nr:hypothetical protein [Candidatus Vicinibacter affinis]
MVQAVNGVILSELGFMGLLGVCGKFCLNWDLWDYWELWEGIFFLLNGLKL